MARFANVIHMQDRLREEQRAWLRTVIQKTGLSPTQLAAKAGVAQPTITRFLNSPNVSHNLTARTISAVERAVGMRYGPNPKDAGFNESDGEPYRYSDCAKELSFLEDAFGKANGKDAWTLKTKAIEAAGYLPGDVLIVDLNETPAPGDVVCAQIYDWSRSRAETVFRLWEPPYLQVATYEKSLRKIFVVDNQNVIIRGVVVASARGRIGRVAA